MAQIIINITLDNISSQIDSQQITNTIENTITTLSGISDIRTSIYDNDGSNNGNPISSRNMMRRIK